MNYPVKPWTWAAAALLVVTCHSTTSGQQPSAQVGTASNRAEREREQREQENQLMMALTEQYHRAPERRAPGLPLVQIRDDYVQLQVINNGLAEAVAAKGPLDLKLVVQATAEIKKRAERLKTNLALPEAKPAGAHAMAVSEAAELEQLKAVLGALDALILKCVRNPLFRSPNLVDANQLAHVSRELAVIVELSAQAKKRSEQLRKAAQKTQ